jgi:hypothetical protein
VSLYPSITRPFDAPEFLCTVRCRHPARGHCFARVSYTVSTLHFWPNSGTLRLPVTRCYRVASLTGRRRRAYIYNSTKSLLDARKYYNTLTVGISRPYSVKNDCGKTQWEKYPSQGSHCCHIWCELGSGSVYTTEFRSCIARFFITEIWQSIHRARP